MKKILELLDNKVLSYKNNMIRVKDQDISPINMVNMIIYDDNDEPIKFDD